MSKIFLLLIAAFFTTGSFSQTRFQYRSLDTSQPISFDGTSFVFAGDTIQLGPKAFFIDGSLPDSVAGKFPFVFNTVQAAAAKVTPGTENDPMILYLAPWVYWIDDPADTAVRMPKAGAAAPYGMEIACEWLHFRGLNSHPQNVVLASNRGQTIGAKGNFTMFRFRGNGISSRDLTFGNFCNVDLVFPLLPVLGKPKRASAIVQAQLIQCNGDKIVARNTRFISRLNLCPFAGAKRVLFDRCHFESTDDALCSTGVYLNSTFDFYSSKPFYNTRGTGAVLLNCSVRSMSGPSQYFTKAGGQLAIVDSRFTGPAGSYWSWQEVMPKDARNYQANVSLNGARLLIGSRDAASTIQMDHLKLLDAYRLVQADTVVYNTYNLLRGDDEWDPMATRFLVKQAEKAAKKKYTGLPVQLVVTSSGMVAETNKNKVTLAARLFCFGNYPAGAEKIFWSVSSRDKALLQLQVSADGSGCTVLPLNKTNYAREVVITASTASGLQGVSVITIQPPILEAPDFKVSPSLRMSTEEKLGLFYSLNSKYGDESMVTWYRTTGSTPGEAIEVAVSREGVPMKEYPLSVGDIGYHIMAVVVPKTVRSKPGRALSLTTMQPISANDATSGRSELKTDFAHQSLHNQPRILPGFFSFIPLPTGEPEDTNHADSTRDAWWFGEGAEGAAGMSGLLQSRHARMTYTPVGTAFGDMQFSLTVSPFKTAGQGFSVAHLYMDLIIKLDAANMNGYALRLVRTTKFSNAVDCMLMKYTNGKAVAITAPVTTSAYRTSCNILLSVKGDVLQADLHSTSPADPGTGEVRGAVTLQARIMPGQYGGIGIEYHGGSPAMINQIGVVWKAGAVK
jgi:hypothetical protein